MSTDAHSLQDLGFRLGSLKVMDSCCMHGSPNEVVNKDGPERNLTLGSLPSSRANLTVTLGPRSPQTQKDFEVVFGPQKGKPDFNVRILIASDFVMAVDSSLHHYMPYPELTAGDGLKAPTTMLFTTRWRNSGVLSGRWANTASCCKP